MESENPIEALTIIEGMQSFPSRRTDRLFWVASKEKPTTKKEKAFYFNIDNDEVRAIKATPAREKAKLHPCCLLRTFCTRLSTRISDRTTWA